MPVVVLILSSCIFGEAVLHLLRIEPSREHRIFSVAIGLCISAVVTLSVGSSSLNALAPVFIISLVLGVVLLWRVRLSRHEKTPKPAQPWTLMEWAAVGATTLTMVLALLSALAPVTHWDATVAHIALAQDYAQAGHLFAFEGNVYSAYPQFMHGLHGAMYLHGGEQAVTLLNWFMALLACGGMYLLGKRLADRQTGLIAIAILATAPIFMDQAGGVGIDLPFTAFIVLALAALATWRDTQLNRWLLIAALLAGSACGIRHTGVLTSVLLGVGVLMIAPEQRLRSAVAFSVLVVIAAFPWLLRSYWVSGNPLYPFEVIPGFANQLIPHSAIGAVAVHESVGTTGGTSLLALLRFPWDIVMYSGRYDGWSKSPGGLVLILGIPGLLLAGRKAWALGGFSVSGIVVFFFFQRLARYMLPFFAPMMVVAALALPQLRKGSRIAQVIVLLSFAFGLVLHAAVVHFKVPVVLGMVDRSTYLEQRVERYPAFVYANEKLDQDQRILTVDQRSYYLNAPAYQNHWGMLTLTTKSPEEQRAWLAERGIGYIIWPEEFLEGSGAIRSLVPVFEQWREDEAYFRVVERLVMDNPRGEGEEHVTLLQVLSTAGEVQ